MENRSTKQRLRSPSGSMVTRSSQQVSESTTIQVECSQKLRLGVGLPERGEGGAELGLSFPRALRVHLLGPSLSQPHVSSRISGKRSDIGFRNSDASGTQETPFSPTYSPPEALSECRALNA